MKWRQYLQLPDVKHFKCANSELSVSLSPSYFQVWSGSQFCVPAAGGCLSISKEFCSALICPAEDARLPPSRITISFQQHDPARK